MIGLALDAADCRVPLAQILARGMAHIDSENVCAGSEKPLDHLRP